MLNLASKVGIAFLGTLVFGHSVTFIAPKLMAQVNPVTPSELDQIPINQIDKELMDLQKYALLDQNTKIVVFDSVSAKRDGYSNAIVKLATEYFEYQNQLMLQIASGKGSSVETSPTEFDSLIGSISFWQIVSHRSKSEGN